MSFKGDLIKAGLHSNGKDIEFFDGFAQLTGRAITVDSTEVTVHIKNEDDKVLLASGTSVPGDESGFAKGCLFIKTDASDGTKGLYENQGTTTSADFNVIGDMTTAEIADSAITSDKMASSVLKVEEVELSSSDIKDLNTSPKELVAAPGSGKVIEFVSAALYLNHGGTDYDTNGDITVRTGTTNTTLSDTIAEADFLFNSADSYRVVQALSADEQLDADEKIELFVATGDPATGNGTLTVKVAYRIHDFS